ncbi:MAG: hypothetical protein O2894_01280 [Planctomycetota bacterium]|nr:hypothetical protein [Planctomycetota bacterium]
MYSRHAEFKAGMVVLLGIAALLVLVWFAAGGESMWAEWRYVHIRFEQGFVAPKQGDAVLMNGTAVGRVHHIGMAEEIRGDGGTKPLTPLDRMLLGLGPTEAGTVRELFVLAVVRLPASQVLPRGTRAQIEETITNLRELHLVPGTSPRNLTDDETRASPLAGSAVAGLGDISKKIDRLVDDVSGVVAQGGEVMTEAKALLIVLREKVNAINTAEMDRDARAALGSLRRSLEAIEARVGNIGDNLEEASADIKRLTKQAVATLERVDGDLVVAMASFKSALANLDGILEESRGPVREILGDIRTTARNAAELTSELSGIGPEARKLIAGLGVDIETLLRNLIDTSRNLQDTSEDVRAHPWKLLNKPDDSEIAYENLRDGALNYMRAMRDLNDASRRLVGLMGRDDIEDPEVRKLLEAAIVEFQDAQNRYRHDEERWQSLFREAGPVPVKGGGRKR